jgi:threonine/homoserine/homoserine lactone efflux protein
VPSADAAAAFRASLVTSAANPKAAVFAFSFFPQFLPRSSHSSCLVLPTVPASAFPQFLPRHGPVLGTTAALAAVQVVIDGSYCAIVVLLASRARLWLSRDAVRRRL